MKPSLEACGNAHGAAAARSIVAGNALFLILIAVALFAALSYAVTQSGRGGSGGVNREKQGLDTALVVQQLGAFQQAVNRLLLSGCTPGMLEFDAPGLTGYNNPSAPTDGSCDVFSAAGGGLTYQPPPAGFSGGEPYLFSGVDRMRGVGDSNSAELSVFLPVVSAQACADFNTRMNLPATTPDDFIIGTKFDGNFSDGGNQIQDDGFPDPAFEGARAACLHGVNVALYPRSAGVDYFIFSVLYER